MVYLKYDLALLWLKAYFQFQNGRHCCAALPYCKRLNKYDYFKIF